MLHFPLVCIFPFLPRFAFRARFAQSVGIRNASCHDSLLCHPLTIHVGPKLWVSFAVVSHCDCHAPLSACLLVLSCLRKGCVPRCCVVTGCVSELWWSSPHKCPTWHLRHSGIIWHAHLICRLELGAWFLSLRCPRMSIHVFMLH